MQELLNRFFNNRYFLLASPAGCEPEPEEVLASQKPNALPTELSGRLYYLLVLITVVFYLVLHKISEAV